MLQEVKSNVSSEDCKVGTRKATHLAGGGMRVDDDLAAASAVTMHSGAHVPPRHHGPDLLQRRDVLTPARLLQRIQRKGGVALNLRVRECLSSPAGGGGGGGLPFSHLVSGPQDWGTPVNGTPTEKVTEACQIN